MISYVISLPLAISDVSTHSLPLYPLTVVAQCVSLFAGSIQSKLSHYH